MRHELVRVSSSATPDEPCFHDLVAVFPVDESLAAVRESTSPSVTYRVFEISTNNFETTCTLLHGTQWLDHGIMPLVLSHSPLPKSQLDQLPRFVPWRLVSGTIRDELEVLRIILVEPLQTRGLICVDFADHASVLGGGGEIKIWSARGESIGTVTADVLRQVACDEGIVQDVQSSLLCLRSGQVISMDQLDRATSAMNQAMPCESIIVTSFVYRPGLVNAPEAFLLSVLRKRCE